VHLLCQEHRGDGADLTGHSRFGPEIKQYLERIDATLAPHGGQYRVHGGPRVTLEGAWSGDVVMIEFPSMDHARAWYASEAYQAIRALRTRHTVGDVFLVEGVPEHHRATDLLKV